MKLYRISAAPAGKRWQAKQDEAQKIAREAGSKFQALHLAENGREELANFLNGIEDLNEDRLRVEVEASLGRAEQADEQKPEERPAIPLKPDAGADFSASQIEGFILERASVAQVERIMAALGCRFGELVKEKRNG